LGAISFIQPSFVHHIFSVSLLKFVLAVSHTFAFGHEADAKISTKYFNLNIFRGFVEFLMADTAIDQMIGYQSSSSLILVHRLLSLHFDDWSMTNWSSAHLHIS
jgi:hypothetical protein